MSLSRRSITALALSSVCLILAVVFLLSRSGDGSQSAVRSPEPVGAPTATPVIYIEPRFPWQAPLARPAPMYGPFPISTLPGGLPKPPIEPGGPSSQPTGLQIRPNYLTPLNRVLTALKVMGGDVNACVYAIDGCLIPAGFLTQFEMVWGYCDQRHLIRTSSHPVVDPSFASFFDEFSKDPVVGQLLRASASVCDAADAAYRRLGTPADTPAWRDAVNAIAAQLDPVMREENARRFDYPMAPSTSQP